MVFNGRIVYIRPKMWMANDGNYRELRYFTPWTRRGQTDDHVLPRMVQQLSGQETVPFGDAVVATTDSVIGVELCEELFTPNGPHIAMGLDGVEVFVNPSASHHELRKLHERINLINEATKKSGGIYLYANQQGCDGDRLYYDGCALIAVNGAIVAQGSQFSLDDVQVVSATVDLDDVRAARCSKSRGMQAVSSEAVNAGHGFRRIPVHHELGARDVWGASQSKLGAPQPMSKPIEVKYLLPEEEIANGPGCWLWDYLRRSRARGYFVPLSGGIDSCATTVIVHSMCRLVHKAAHEGNKHVLADVRRICEQSDLWVPESPQEIAQHLFVTCYMGTENSSKDTRQRAKDLARDIGA